MFSQMNNCVEKYKSNIYVSINYSKFQPSSFNKHKRETRNMLLSVTVWSKKKEKMMMEDRKIL